MDLLSVYKLYSCSSVAVLPSVMKSNRCLSDNVLEPANRIGCAHAILRMNPRYSANGF